MSIRSPQPFKSSAPKRKEHSDGLSSSRYHTWHWQEFTGRYVEVAGRSFEQLYRPLSPGAVPSLGGRRCLGCCRELELANGRRAVSRRRRPALRVDDVQVRATRGSRVATAS